MERIHKAVAEEIRHSGVQTGEGWCKVMSGGRFDYVDGRLKDEIFGWTDVPRNVFEDREISELVWDVLNLIHDFDWYASGDTCKETYLKAKAEFKKKWFGDRGVRVRQIVDDALKQAKDELYETFGLGDDLMERMVDDGK